MKKKLLITVGAGASIDFGISSSSELDNLLDECASKSHPLAGTRDSNFYRYCRDSIKSLYESNKKPRTVGFEEVLYQINNLATHLCESDYANANNALLKPRDFPEILHNRTIKKSTDTQLKT